MVDVNHSKCPSCEEEVERWKKQLEDVSGDLKEAIVCPHCKKILEFVD